MTEQALGWAAEGRGLVVFLPGTWTHSTAWSSWQTVFDSNGYDSLIAGWPGEMPPGGSGPVHRPTGLTVGALLTSTTEVLSGLHRRPILIGHGMGAVLAQVLLGQRGLAAAAVAIAPVHAGWVSPTALLRCLPVAISLGRSALPTDGRISSAAFAAAYANTRPATEAADLYRRYVIPSSSRPLLQVSCACRQPGLLPIVRQRPPLLLVSGGKDRLGPESAARSWQRFGRRHFPDSVTDHHVFPDRGHSLIMDAGREDVANLCLDWLSTQNL